MQKSVHVGDLEETENTETERVEVANCSRVVFPWQNLNSKQKNLGLSQKRISTPPPTPLQKCAKLFYTKCAKLIVDIYTYLESASKAQYF